VGRLESAGSEKGGVAKPFLKWAGGKARLLSQYRPYFPDLGAATYHEPFLGGGAVYFRLAPSNARLADLNEELVLCYQVVRDHPAKLISDLRRHRTDREYFYKVRGTDPARLDSVRRASRIIFLNKTCYNGLYRVNRDGQFNVPYGRYARPVICDAENLRTASRALRSARLSVGPFEVVLDHARRGDFVYFDPPYQPLSPTSSFTAYTHGAFGEADQRRLGAVFAELDRRGCRVMLSNSDTPLVRGLYRGFQLIEVRASRSINSVGSRRGRVGELLVLNY